MHSSSIYIYQIVGPAGCFANVYRLPNLTEISSTQSTGTKQTQTKDVYAGTVTAGAMHLAFQPWHALVAGLSLGTLSAGKTLITGRVLGISGALK